MSYNRTLATLAFLCFYFYLSYTRKVTYFKSSGGWILNIPQTFTVSQQSPFSSSGWVQVPQLQQQMVVRQTVQPTVTLEVVTSSNFSDTNKNSRSHSTFFDAAVLYEHNRLRAKHSATSLMLDPTLSKYAQEWANNIARRNVMQHRSNNPYGENIYACFGKTDLTGAEVVQSWYNEIKDYRFGEYNPSNSGKVGHFTQVVWKKSKRLGVGIARNGNNVYVVCNYDPSGNFPGQYPTNVTPN